MLFLHQRKHKIAKNEKKDHFNLKLILIIIFNLVLYLKTQKRSNWIEGFEENVEFKSTQ